MNDPLTSKIIAAAYKVYNTLGFGFSEKIELGLLGKKRRLRGQRLIFITDDLNESR